VTTFREVVDKEMRVNILPPCEVQLWVSTEGGTHHMACGPKDRIDALANRFLNAKVAYKCESAPCCEVMDWPCAFDLEEGNERAALVIHGALAKAEGRTATVEWVTEMLRPAAPPLSRKDTD
jgi:hypothetical protein